MKHEDTKMGQKAWEIFFKFHHLIGFALVTLTGVALYLNHNYSYWSILRKTMKEEQQRCDFYSGRWVYDNIPYPLYKEEQCSFMDRIFACEKNGKKDTNYRHWRWQPHHCDIPRFNGKEFLEKIRGKKVLFVGDSLNRNQWVSLLCLIESSLPPSSNKSLTMIGNCNYFHSFEYNTTIGMYWSPYLVESNCDGYGSHSNLDHRVVKIEAIEEHAKHWNDADILIFNSYVWWLNPMTLLWGSFENPNAITEKIDPTLRPYEMGMRTWSDWLEMNINRTKTKLFYMGASPYTERKDALRHCYNKTQLITEDNLIPINPHNQRDVLEPTMANLRRRGINVEYIGITRMSEYRIDAHPSIYRAYMGHLRENAKKDPMAYTDCLHWCLPGVPDIWNQILYYHIMKS